MKSKTLGGSTTQEVSNSARYATCAELRSLLRIVLKYDVTLTMRLMRALNQTQTSLAKLTKGGTLSHEPT